MKNIGTHPPSLSVMSVLVELNCWKYWMQCGNRRRNKKMDSNEEEEEEEEKEKEENQDDYWPRMY